MCPLSQYKVLSVPAQNAIVWCQEGVKFFWKDVRKVFYGGRKVSGDVMWCHISVKWCQKGVTKVSEKYTKCLMVIGRQLVYLPGFINYVFCRN